LLPRNNREEKQRGNDEDLKCQLGPSPMVSIGSHAFSCDPSRANSELLDNRPIGRWDVRGPALKWGHFQIELFGSEVCEVAQTGVAYVLRRNPVRAEELAADKQARVEHFIAERNRYLGEHPRRPGSID